MNDIFLKNGNSTKTYHELVEAINSSEFYYPVIRTNDIFELFKNIIIGVIYNQELTLLDSDISSNEIVEIDSNLINHKKYLNQVISVSLEVIMQKILASDASITIFTSGTTGQPKKVSHSIHNLIRSVRTGINHKDDVWGFAYNPTHMSGLQVFFQAILNKNSIVNIFGQQRTDVLASLKANEVTHLSGTPTFFRLLLPTDIVIDSIKRVTFGGEKSDQKLYDNVLHMFPNAKITNVYASTEAGSLFAAKNDCFQIPNSLLSQIKIDDGELLIHKSLLGHSDSFTYKGDYYCSGDIIEWVDQEKGLFRFKSRKNEMVNVGGYKVNPAEVEDLISSIDGISQVVVYGKPNSILGNVLCADIRLEDGVNITETDIRKILHGKLQDFKIPRRIKFVKEFSVTRTGKIKRT